MATLAEYEERLADLEREADGLRAAGDLAGEARVTARIGRVHFLRGTPKDGIGRIRSIIDRLPEDAPPAVRLDLYLSLAPLYWLAGRYRALLGAAVEAADLALRAGGPVGELAEAEVWRGVALVSTERTDEGIRVLEGAIPLARQAGDLMSLSRAYNSLAATYEERGEFDREGPYLDRALEAAERLGDPIRLAYMLYRKGWREWIVGLWSESRRDLERAMALSEDAGPSWVTPYVHYGLGSLCFVEGDWPAAVQHLSRCVELADRGGDARVRWAAKSLMAERDLLEGRPQAVRDRLEPLLDSAGLEEGGVALLLALLAQAYLAMGDARRAEMLITRAAGRAGANANRPALAEVRRVQGLVAAEQGRWEDAERALEDALELTRAMNNPYALARVLHTFGLCHARRGDVRSAEDRLQEAAAVFRGLGARTNLEQTERLLADL